MAGRVAGRGWRVATVVILLDVDEDRLTETLVAVVASFIRRDDDG